MRLDFQFRCLVGVNSVVRYRETQKGSNAGTGITGKWNEKLEWLTPKQPGQLAVDFANETDVLRFTNRYGPLENSLSDFTTRLAPDDWRVEKVSRLASRLPPFRFPESEWRDRQEQFRMIWETLPVELRLDECRIFPHIVGIEDLVITRKGFRLPVKGAFGFVADRLIFRAFTLWELLLLDLSSVGRERLRKCECPKCEKSYFVGKSSAKFCEDSACRRWGRNQTKLNWWNANRRDVGIPTTKQKRNGRKHGTQKTR